MKKLIYLFLMLFASVAYSQADFPEGVQISGGQPTTTTDPYITTTGSTGLQGKVSPINMPVTITPPTTFYTPVTSDLKGHLQGIDNALGDIPLTTAGNTTRVWFTGDDTTITSGTFYLTNPSNKGTVANVSQSVTNDDNQKKYFTQDLIGNAFATTTIFPPGVYAGNLSASTTPNSAQQRFTVELYRCDTNGTPIASGIAGAPVGDLGVTVILILDSGLLTLADGSVTNVQVSASLASQLTVNVGERIRYHVSAEKVGTVASNITESVWYGSSFNSFLDVPTPITSSGVTNVSTVTGSSVTNALDNLKVADQDVAGVGVTYGHITDGAQTIAGNKTFTGTTTLSTPALVTGVNKLVISDAGIQAQTLASANRPLDLNINGGHINFGDKGFYNSDYKTFIMGDNSNQGLLLGSTSDFIARGSSLSGTVPKFRTQGVNIQGYIFGDRVNGTFAAPTALNNDDFIVSFGGLGYHGTGGAGTHAAEMQIHTNQAWTATQRGARFEFHTIRNGEIATTLAATLGKTGQDFDVVNGFVKGQNAQIGVWSVNSSFARFGHEDFNINGAYGFLQQDTGELYLKGNNINFDALGGGFNFNNGSLVSPSLTGTPTAPTATAGTNTTQIATTAFVQTAVGSQPLQYKALVSQSGTSDPTVTILKNTIGSIVWTRSATGGYLGTLTGAFPAGKVISYSTTASYGGAVYPTLITIGRQNDNSVFLVTRQTDSAGTSVDSALSQATIIIEVYP